jgi:hypothetical protein
MLMKHSSNNCVKSKARRQEFTTGPKASSNDAGHDEGLVSDAMAVRVGPEFLEG